METNNTTIFFVGGPLDGQTRSYQSSDSTIMCTEEAAAKGMYGRYFTQPAPPGTSLTATWYNMPRPDDRRK